MLAWVVYFLRKQLLNTDKHQPSKEGPRATPTPRRVPESPSNEGIGQIADRARL